MREKLTRQQRQLTFRVDLLITGQGRRLSGQRNRRQSPNDNAMAQFHRPALSVAQIKHLNKCDFSIPIGITLLLTIVIAKTTLNYTTRYSSHWPEGDYYY